ncbi:hypothetical protein OMAG_000239, partial [Candidatus Omnitrophus magneticus]
PQFVLTKTLASLSYRSQATLEVKREEQEKRGKKEGRGGGREWVGGVGGEEGGEGRGG